MKENDLVRSCPINITLQVKTISLFGTKQCSEGCPVVANDLYYRCGLLTAWKSTETASLRLQVHIKGGYANCRCVVALRLCEESYIKA